MHSALLWRVGRGWCLKHLLSDWISRILLFVRGLSIAEAPWNNLDASVSLKALIPPPSSPGTLKQYYKESQDWFISQEADIGLQE